MENPPSVDREIRRYVAVVAALAALALAGAAFLVARGGLARPTLLSAGAAALFVAAFFVLGQTSFTFAWRGHRHRMVLDEVALYVGLLVLEPALIVLLVAASSVMEQLRLRRGLTKAVFNVGSNVVAAALAASLYAALTGAGAAPVLAALPAAILHPFVSDFLVAGILARLAQERHVRLFAERFLGPGLVAGSVGAGGGVAVATLFSVHPLTLLSLVPFVFLTYRYGVLTAVADRELEVHKRLAEAAQNLVGTTDLEQAARSILAAVGDVLPTCARAELALHDRQEPIVAGFGGEPNLRARPVEVPVPGNARASGEGQPIGILRVHARRGAAAVTEVEHTLLRIVAGQLGAAIEEARALSREERARRRLEAYLGTAPDAILLIEEGLVRYANPAAQRLFALDPARPHDVSELLPAASEILASLWVGELVETRARALGGGREMVVEVHGGAVPETDGTLLLVRDITERKRLEQESAAQREMLARQEKLSALGTLVAGVAHEINNPVTYMRGALELASLDLDDVAAHAGASGEAGAAVDHARKSLQRLAQGVDRVERITHALKAVARQGNGERAPEDVRAIVEDVVQVVRVGLPKGVRLEARVEGELPRVEANASELHQVLLNLVKNAAEALAPTGGAVEVVAYAEAGVVRVDVVDDGPGIPEEVQRRLFEPFFTTKRNGTGLGLSLSKGIVEAHGGRLALASMPGVGTRFSLELPAMRDQR